MPGLLLIGLGAGLLLPTATNSVVGSVPQGDSGIGSATNAVALQVGGALGVAVIGSVLSTRYQDHMTTALAGGTCQPRRTHAILGSLGGALAVADAVGRCHRQPCWRSRPRRVHERQRRQHSPSAPPSPSAAPSSCSPACRHSPPGSVPGRTTAMSVAAKSSPVHSTGCPVRSASA